MPRYAFSGTPSSTAYALMDSDAAFSLTGGIFPLPPEYQPLSVEVEERLEDSLAPLIRATYFDMVDLQEGALWPITDPQDRVLHVGVVSNPERDPEAGTVSYTFVTFARRLSIVEPPALFIGAEEAGHGATSNADEMFDLLISHLRQDLPQLSVAPNRPSFVLRATGGDIQPYLHFVSLWQPGGDQNKTARDLLDEWFGIFGYGYRMVGSTLHVIPPAYQQLTALELTSDDIISRRARKNYDRIINSQRVSNRPYVKQGEVPSAEVKEPSEMVVIAEPTYYRQGDTEHVAKPADRKFMPENWETKILFREDAFPITPPVRVIWKSYVFGTFYDPNGEVRYHDLTEGHTRWKTHVVDLGAGRIFKAKTFWYMPGDTFAQVPFEWQWWLTLSADGTSVDVELVMPQGNPTYEATFKEPGTGFFEGPHTHKLGAEFHLTILGQAWVKSNVTYSSVYGHYSPPTLPASMEASVFPAGDTDPEVAASFLRHGLMPGREISIENWSISETPPTPEELQLGTVSPNINGPLARIAEAVVKTFVEAPEEITVQAAPPFALSAEHLGRLVSLPPAPTETETKTAQMMALTYREAHTMAGSDYAQTLALEVRRDTSIGNPTIVPPEEPAPVEYVPPGYPVGEYPPPTQISKEPITVGPGMVNVDFGRRADVLTLERVGSAELRVRLYRTDAARAGDAARPPTEMVQWNPAEPAEELATPVPVEYADLLILDVRIPAGGDGVLDLHAVLGHTPEGVCYANIQGGAVTIHRYLPEGRHG